MKTYSKEGTPLAEALLVIEDLTRVLAHHELQVQVDELELSDASSAALARAACFLPAATLAELPYDALLQAYEDLPLTVKWPEVLKGQGAEGVSVEDYALAQRLATAMQSAERAPHQR
jgi:hypothetical protein